MLIENHRNFADETVLQVQGEQSTLLLKSLTQQREEGAVFRYGDSVTRSYGGWL